MMSPRGSRLFLLSAVAAGPLVAGCGESDSEQRAVKPAPAAPTTPTREQPVERQARVDVSKMIADQRVQFPEERAPTDEGLARSIVTLATAIAEGDSERLRGLLDEPAQAVLDSLVEHGEWEQATSGIEIVRVCALDASGQQAKIGLGIEDPQGAYLLSWQGSAARGGWRFSGLATPAQTAETASALDGTALREVAAPQPRAAKAEVEIDPFRGQRDEEGDRGRRPRRRGVGPGRIGGF